MDNIIALLLINPILVACRTLKMSILLGGGGLIAPAASTTQNFSEKIELGSQKSKLTPLSLIFQAAGANNPLHLMFSHEFSMHYIS